MRVCPRLLGFALLVLLAIQPETSRAVTALLAHWPAEGNALDVSGNGYHGALMNGATFGAGIEGATGFDLDGVDDYVATNSTLGNGAAAITVEAWVNPRALPDPGVVGTWDYIVSTDDAGSFAAYSLFSLSINRHGSVSYLPSSMSGYSVSFGIRAVGQPEVHAALGHPDVSYYASYWWGQAIAPNPPELALNQWTHLVGVYDGAQTRLYINGRLAATSSAQPDGANRSVSGPLVTTTNETRIGRPNYDAGPTYGSFSGRIDGVRIYTRALSACEITEAAGGECTEPAPPAASCTGVADGLVSCWGGEGNALDSRTLNNGTLHNGVTFAPGVVGQAFRFDGVNDYVRVLDSASLDVSSQMTVAAWVKPEVNRGGGLVYKTVPVSQGWSPPYQAYGLYYSHWEHDAAYYMAHGGATSYRSISTPDNSGPLNQWHHLAGTYDGQVMRVYVDGVLTNSSNIASVITATSGHLYFGTHREDLLTDTNATFGGLLDEIRLYDRALDECELRELARNPCEVADTTGPVIAAPSGPTAEAASASGAIVSYAVSATDDVDGDVEVVCSPESGIAFALGVTTVECTASDAAGNETQASFEVTVEDTTSPSLTVPANQVVEATGPPGAVVAYPPPVVIDAVDPAPSVQCGPLSGSTFALGTTTVSCTATDSSGNAVSHEFTVTVRDTTPPVLTLPADITTLATGAAGAAVSFVANASDIVDASVAVACVPASGSVFPIGTTSVDCMAVDDSNDASGSFRVSVVVTVDAIDAVLRRWIVNRGILNSLMVKLRQGSYDAFRHEVRALTGKWLTAAQATELLVLVGYLEGR